MDSAQSIEPDQSKYAAQAYPDGHHSVGFSREMAHMSIVLPRWFQKRLLTISRMWKSVNES